MLLFDSLPSKTEYVPLGETVKINFILFKLIQISLHELGPVEQNPEHFECFDYLERFKSYDNFSTGILTLPLDNFACRNSQFLILAIIQFLDCHIFSNIHFTGFPLSWESCEKL